MMKRTFIIAGTAAIVLSIRSTVLQRNSVKLCFFVAMASGMFNCWEYFTYFYSSMLASIAPKKMGIYIGK